MPKSQNGDGSGTAETLLPVTISPEPCIGREPRHTIGRVNLIEGKSRTRFEDHDLRCDIERFDHRFARFIPARERTPGNGDSILIRFRILWRES
jgi:hypothetical protein